MKAYSRSGGIAPRILDLGNRKKRVVSITVRPLYPQGKSPCYPLDRKRRRPQSRSANGGEEKNSHPLPELEVNVQNPSTGLFQHQNGRHNHNLLTANKTFENMAKF
jgi:hypothetical protein